ncbi:MAG TPA: tyrosine--tRNA ligase [Gaiellaceae bacterium]|nr:tyrosine--tRNA ligase [Gaiellaceae bacterium]
MGIAELTRNAASVLPEGGLEAKLKLGRPLRVKLGIDVTAPDVTLGNGIPLQRMRAFQDEGHLGVLIVGDYTTRIGDPSGRKSERPIIAPEVIDANAQRYFEHASTIIDPERTEVRFNGEWLSKLDFAEVLKLTRTTTVARILERDDFHRRFGASEPISLSELLYPMMQAYDSVAVEADIELGGTDQTYNLLMGREVMQAYGLEPQVALTVAYLDSWDGTGMSASRGNYIGLKEPPEEQFGKAMRIPDSLLDQWYRLVMERDGVPEGDPMEAKLELARFIVRRAWGEEAARAAEEHFTRVVRRGEAPDDVPAVEVKPGLVYVPKLLADVFGNSVSYWRRLMAQGAVRLDGEIALTEFNVPSDQLDGRTLFAGRRQFLRVIVSGT